MAEWRQGDIVFLDALPFYYVTDSTSPSTLESCASAQTTDARVTEFKIGAMKVVGWVILTQTCDIVRSYKFRPFIEMVPLVKVSQEILYDVQRSRRFNFAYIPAAAPLGLVADLTRTMAVEKTVIAGQPRMPGWAKDEEIVAIAGAFVRKWRRFAFPDDFILAARDLLRHINRRHNKQDDTGYQLRHLSEIRVIASPSWDSDRVSLRLLFIISDQASDEAFDWPTLVGKCSGMIDTSGRFMIGEAVACTLDDLTAREYSLSQHLELDHLSYEGDR